MFFSGQTRGFFFGILTIIMIVSLSLTCNTCTSLSLFFKENYLLFLFLMGWVYQTKQNNFFPFFSPLCKVNNTWTRSRVISSLQDQLLTQRLSDDRHLESVHLHCDMQQFFIIFFFFSSKIIKTFPPFGQ